MDESIAVSPSYSLDAALVEYHRFLVADDFERSDLLESADWETLVDLVERITPLIPEIEGLLGRLKALQHPLREGLESLEYDLTLLRQAGLEAQLVLRERGGA